MTIAIQPPIEPDATTAAFINAADSPAVPAELQLSVNGVWQDAIDITTPDFGTDLFDLGHVMAAGEILIARVRRVCDEARSAFLTSESVEVPD